MTNKNNINDLKMLIGSDVYDKILETYNKSGKNGEFEFIFSSGKGKYLSQQKYINILKFLNIRKNKYNLKSEGPLDFLDIVYSDNIGTSYRLTIDGNDNINKYMRKLELYKNHVIFSTLVKIYTEKKEDISHLNLMKKTKTSDNTIDVNELDMRVRLSQEESLTKDEIKKVSNLEYTELDNIVFRFKHRLSVYVYSKDDEYVKIDITLTKTSQIFKNFNKTVPNYELEVEHGVSSKPTKEAFDIMIKEVELLHKIMQQSNFIINNSTSSKVIRYYKDIANVSESATFIDARQPKSLEIQHIADTLPDKYAVTDKADGDRYFMIIMNKHVYFISGTLNVKDSGIDLADNGADGSICDGEYIFIPKMNRHLFMIFDCLFHSNSDVRDESSLLKRHSYATDLINKYFILGNQKGYKSEKMPTSSEFSLNEIVKYHEKEIRKYFENLNNDMAIEKDKILIRKKYFIAAMGAKKWEIYKYSELIWKLYTEDPTVKCPYLLDGLIYHPLEQKYVTSDKESKLSEYKWKPPKKNSIDFYIQFEKDKETRKIVTVYDNSKSDVISNKKIDDNKKSEVLEEDNEDDTTTKLVANKPYRICRLYVGKKIKFQEQPVLFREEDNAYWAYLYLQDGEVRDVEGNIISDNTVVEFYYDSDSILPERFRWIPLKTRYDKTEAVLRFNKRYGNYIDVAEKVWRSILNPLLMSDIKDLAQGNDPDKKMFMYDKKNAALREKIGHELIITASKENAYYQKISNLSKDMRDFHNFIKSNIIYTYCHPIYQDNKQLSVLDIGCGRGGDINKFYYAEIAFYVGFDFSYQGITSPTDGAISRYNNERKKKARYPKMYFIHADGGALLNYDDQYKALGGMNNENKLMIEKFFPKDPTKRTLFDRINCQFVMHYFLKDETSWSNFKQNLNSTLRSGGYYMATTLDARRVIKEFGDKDTITVEYTDDKGKKVKLWELIKKFGDIDLKKPIKYGVPIDVYLGWIFEEGNNVTEYLVDDKFIQQDLLESCDLELIETDLFENQFNIHREFFEKYASYNTKTPILGRIKSYYTPNEINTGCYKYTNLTRYFVFRKKDTPSKKQTGGSVDFSNTKEYIVPDMEGYDPHYSYFNSVHNVLRTHKIIPRSISVSELFKDLKMNLVNDLEVDYDKIKKISKKIAIENDIEMGINGKKLIKETEVDGLNLFIVQRDCNGFYDVDCIENGDKKKAMILMKEGDLYKPVYKTTNKDKRIGLFNMNDPLIKNLYDQADIY